MPYQAAIRLASVAITPAVLLDVLFAFEKNKGLPLWGFIILASAYTGFAVYSNREPSISDQ